MSDEEEWRSAVVADFKNHAKDIRRLYLITLLLTLLNFTSIALLYVRTL